MIVAAILMTGLAIAILAVVLLGAAHAACCCTGC
jgi:hypothetical protein